MAIKKIKKVKVDKEKASRRQEILKEIEQKESSGEVVGSHALDKGDPLQRIKWNLCREILIAKRLLNLSSKGVSEIIGLDKSRTSEIMHYKFDQFTIDRLLSCFLSFKGMNQEIDQRIENIFTAFSSHTQAS